MVRRDYVLDIGGVSGDLPEAGAPEIEVTPKMVEAARFRAELEEAFYRWWANNDHFLSADSCGDVTALWAAFGSAALTNASKSGSSGANAF
jgi:hypothetical protein